MSALQVLAVLAVTALSVALAYLLCEFDNE